MSRDCLSGCHILHLVPYVNALLYYRLLLSSMVIHDFPLLFEPKLPLGQPAHIRGARKLSHVITPTNCVDFLITAYSNVTYTVKLARASYMGRQAGPRGAVLNSKGCGASMYCGLELLAYGLGVVL